MDSDLSDGKRYPTFEQPGPPQHLMWIFKEERTASFVTHLQYWTKFSQGFHVIHMNNNRSQWVVQDTTEDFQQGA